MKSKYIQPYVEFIKVEQEKLMDVGVSGTMDNPGLSHAKSNNVVTEDFEEEERHIGERNTFSPWAE